MVGRPRTAGKRPWLAALLGTLATGLGHFYLRRWKRGLGWVAVALAVSALLVPPEAARALVSGGGDLATLAPLLAVGVASVADAYVLARMQQREPRDRAGDGASAGPTSESESAAESRSRNGSGDGSAVGRASESGDAECQECGKELDPDLDFCPWCTVRLGGEAEE
jgi:hypothetical protein